MTDERPQGESGAPAPGTPDPAAPEPVVPDPVREPPPLAPLVEQAGAVDPTTETTPQPTSTWQALPAAPAVPPAAPAVPPAAPAAPPPELQRPAVAWAPETTIQATGRPRVTGLSFAAGILLVLGGILGGLLGLAVAVFGRAVIETIGDLGEIPGLEGSNAAAFASAVITFVGIIVVVYSLIYLVAGIGVLRSRDWGRVLGVIVGILSGLLWLGGLTTPDQPGVRESAAGSLVMLAIHAYIVIALLFFWRRRAAAA